ncbi:MAG: HIT domain-containing protein [Deltaproteobacteria bacterium]|jgi:diadenosine tetraphosphate (Ap4A) HIT family hydrolase|nr:HIT domain-containing protein [Deltaproteobacteria bacterium]
MTEKCIFCEIANGRIPSVRVYEDADFIAFMDINPTSDGHLLLITRSHYKTTSEVPDKQLAKALPLAKKLALAAQLGVGSEGYNILINNGPVSGQLVEHWHLHIIPRKDKSEFPMKAGQPADLTKLPFIAASIRDNL